MESTLEKPYEQIDEIEIAMMTTQRPDGHLESRETATQNDRGHGTKDDPRRVLIGVDFVTG